MSDYDEFDLSMYDEEFENAEVEERDFEAVPDGNYQVMIDRIELTRTKASGEPMLKWTLKILGPRCEGRLLWRYNLMASKENIKWLKTDLWTAGLRLEKLSELQGRLEELLDVTLEIKKQTRGDNENIYINKRIVVDSAGATGGGGDAAIDSLGGGERIGEDGLPF